MSEGLGSMCARMQERWTRPLQAGVKPESESQHMCRRVRRAREGGEVLSGGRTACGWKDALLQDRHSGAAKTATKAMSEPTGADMLPNVRTKLAPAAKGLGRAADDELHCSAAQALCCWGSA